MADESDMAYVVRGEADPRDAARVRPWMTVEERAELYAALEEEARAARALYTGEATDDRS